MNEPQANIFHLFRTWLLSTKQQRKWVIILDNADDIESLLRPPKASDQTKHGEQDQMGQDSERFLEYLPFCENGSLLVTTRSQDAALEIVDFDDIVSVNPMDETQALCLLKKKLGIGIKCTDGELLQLVTELDSMPLALAQAAAYIRQRSPRSTVQDYLERLSRSEKSRLELLTQNARDLRRDRNAQNCILKTWQISFDYIHQFRSSAADLLSLMSFFDRQAIPEHLLYKMEIKPCEDSVSQYIALRSETSETDVQVLLSYFLISTTACTLEFQMHRLVQLSTQEWLKANNRFDRWQTQFLCNLDEHLPFLDFHNWPTCQRLFPHAVNVTKAEPAWRESILRQASILQKGGGYAIAAALYVDAEKMMKQAVEIKTAWLGPIHEKTLHSGQAIGYLLQALGRNGEAERARLHVLEGCKILFGQEHRRTLEAMSELAEAHHSMGRLREARDLGQKTLEKCVLKLGEQDVITQRTMAILALTLGTQGEYESAMNMAQRALEVARILLPENHPMVLGAKHNLAIRYTDTGHYDRAKQLQEEVLQGAKTSIGEDHPNTLIAMFQLAAYLRLCGSRVSALNLMRECCAKTFLRMGPDHPYTVMREQRKNKWEAEDSQDIDFRNLCGPEDAYSAEGRIEDGGAHSGDSEQSSDHVKIQLRTMV